MENLAKVYVQNFELDHLCFDQKRKRVKKIFIIMK